MDFFGEKIGVWQGQPPCAGTGIHIHTGLILPLILANLDHVLFSALSPSKRQRLASEASHNLIIDGPIYAEASGSVGAAVGCLGKDFVFSISITLSAAAINLLALVVIYDDSVYH